LNHPAWWDPLVGIFLAERWGSDRRHFAPIDGQALGRYRFFEKLGFFGIDPRSPAGAARFLRTSLAILDQGDAALWITPQGRFADPRERPLGFEPGLAHLARRLSRGWLLPLALEFPFWEEKTPEVLVLAGEPIQVREHPSLDVRQWNALLESRLEEAMEKLAVKSIRRQPNDFEILLSGSAGVGGVYDLWRRLRARLTGHEFRSEHGGPKG
jgi:1-acyl-sn-glycerol-3-phosphate acyltransferase